MATPLSAVAATAAAATTPDLLKVPVETKTFEGFNDRSGARPRTVHQPVAVEATALGAMAGTPPTDVKAITSAVHFLTQKFISDPTALLAMDPHQFMGYIATLQEFNILMPAEYAEECTKMMDVTQKIDADFEKDPDHYIPPPDALAVLDVSSEAIQKISADIDFTDVQFMEAFSRAYQTIFTGTREIAAEQTAVLQLAGMMNAFANVPYLWAMAEFQAFQQDLASYSMHWTDNTHLDDLGHADFKNLTEVTLPALTEALSKVPGFTPPEVETK